MKIRLYGYDNLKFGLIFCVVLAHFLEICGPFTGKNFMYFLIYSFHMPAFIFIMGLFSKDSVKVLKYIYIYIIFQTIYICLVDGVFFHKGIVLQYSTPVWVLWYLLAMIFYMALTPAVLAIGPKKQITLFLVSLIFAILVGFDDTVGYYLSLSRIIVFFPFYVLGCMLKPYKENLETYLITKRKAVLLFSLILAAIITFVVYKFSITNIRVSCLYGSYCYEALQYSWRIRTMQLAVAFLWIILFVLIESLVNFKLPILSNIGQNTLPVFLVHGILVKYALSRNWFVEGGKKTFLILVFLSFVILILLGNKKTNRLVCMDFLQKLP